MSKLIARAKIIDESTGEEIPVDVRTCADAVTCVEGKTMQQHLKILSDHMKDEASHPTDAKRAEWDAKETPTGAQAKADAAKNAAVAMAQTIATTAKNAAITVANEYCNLKAENAKKDAINAAAADATRKIEAFEITTAKIPDKAVTFAKLADDAIPADRVIKQGTSEGWTYRCWSSGKVEAWLSTVAILELSAAFTLTTSEGDRALLKGTFPSLDIPAGIKFPDVPKIFCSVDSDIPVWCCSNRANRTTITPELTIYSWSAGSSVSQAVCANYYCVAG